MALLQQSAMELSFNTRDVIYIVVGAIAIFGNWFYFKFKLTELEDKHKLLTENLINYKAARKARNKEFEELMDKKLDKMEHQMENKIDLARQDSIRESMKLEETITQFGEKFDKFLDKFEIFKDEMLRSKK